MPHPPRAYGYRTYPPSIAKATWATDWRTNAKIRYTGSTMRKAIQRIFADSMAAKKRFLRHGVAALEDAIRLTCETLARGNTLFFFGNGGSAADAQHLAAEFVNRFKLQRAPLPAIALTTDSSALTSIANDCGFREVFAKQLEALARPGDLAFAISTSGRSPNVLRALTVCRKLGVRTVGLTGSRGKDLARKVDCLLCVDGSGETARIQETHILIGHTICELSELRLAGPPIHGRKTPGRQRTGG